MNEQRKSPERSPPSRRGQSIFSRVVNWYRKTSKQMEELVDERPLFYGLSFFGGPPLAAGALAAGGIWLLGPPSYWVTMSVLTVFGVLWTPFLIAVRRGMDRAYPPDYKTIAPIMMLMGVLFFGVGAYLVGGKIVELSDALETPVVVVELEQEEDRKGEIRYRPVFEMTRSDGTRLRYADDLWSSPPSHQKGEVLPGRYSPSSGMVASNRHIRNHLVFGAIFALIGGVLFSMGIYFGRKKAAELN